MKGKHIFWAVLLTLISAFCYVMIKAGLDYAPPLRFGGLRTLIAGTALLGWAFARHEPMLPSKTRWKGILLLAFVGATLVFGAMFLSPGLAGAGIASVLGNAQALFTVALAALFLGERLSTGKAAAMALGLSGVMVISYPALRAAHSESILGMGLALTVSAGTAIGTVIVKQMRVRQGLLSLTGWQFVLGSLPLLAVSALLERGYEVRWTITFGGLLLFLALVQTAFSTVVWYWLLQQEEVGRLSLFFFFVPIFGLGISAVVFREPINLVEGAGIAVILVGIAVLMWEASRKPAQAFTYCPFCSTAVAV
ncbi:MAG: DMT family transporter [Anaerolineae bacterium]|nr:DMT family transporter [Anaerolineae bacterium]